MGTTIFTPFTEKELIPKEEKLEIVRKEKKFSIGIPKDVLTKKDFVLLQMQCRY